MSVENLDGASRAATDDPKSTGIFRLTWLLLVTSAFLWLIWPYFAPIVWGFVLAVQFYPLREWLCVRARLGNIGATLATLAICAIGVILPVTLITMAIARELSHFRGKIRAKTFDLDSAQASIVDSITAYVPTWLTQFFDTNQTEIRSQLSKIVGSLAEAGSNYLLELGQNSLLLIIAFSIMLYLLFFFLKDGAKIVRAVARHAPLDEPLKKDLISTLKNVIRATVQGNFIIAILQGAIGGVLMWGVGLDGAFLLGVLMALMSLIPAVGAAAVWLPVAIWFLFTGAFGKAAIVIFVGTVVIGTLDNLLRPPLVGKGAGMPDYLVFLSTIGGLSVLGISGFVLGPMIAATFLVSWRHYKSNTTANL